MRILLLGSLVATSVFALSGCAYFTNYTRSVDLDHHSYVMDVKQRVVVAQKRPSAGNAAAQRVVCAEPSPDALTVISASGGLSIDSGKADVAGKLGGALSENGAFVGLRTHSIQLLRDAMYRLCEGYASGAIDEMTYRSMQRRYQSTMMGLIAIEQLTGPVIASQALLTTAAAAQAGATPGDSALASAQARADKTGDEAVQAQSELDDLDAQTEAALKKSSEAAKALAAERAKKEPNDETIKDLVDKAKVSSEDFATVRRKRDASRRKLALLEGRAKEAGRDLEAARSRVSAMASGAGTLGGVAGAMTATSEALTNGAVDIVKEINISYLRDYCFSFSTDLLKNPTLLMELQALKTLDDKGTISPAIMIRSVTSVCRDVLAIDAARTARAAGVSDEDIEKIRRDSKLLSGEAEVDKKEESGAKK